jgi:hypothetical protein
MDPRNGEDVGDGITVLFLIFHFVICSYFTFSKNASRTNDVGSFRKTFHKTAGDIKGARDWLRGDKFAQAGSCGGAGKGRQGLARGGSGRGFDSHQLNCAFSFLLLCFLLFSSFPLSSHHICMFACLQKKYSAHDQYTFHQEDVS